MSDANSNKLFKYFVGIAGLIIIIVIALLIYYWVTVVRYGELGEKEPYSLLQGVEINHRNDEDKTTPILVSNLSNSGYDVLGIASHDKKFPRTWIILNKVAPDGTVLMLPAGMNSHVNCQDIATLHLKEISNPKILNFLTNSCVN